MNSLLSKESMGGRVQTIYMDPPCGIKYGSNLQPFVNKRDVKDHADSGLTQEPETIKAFRDTREPGIHSYLAYLWDRLLLARELSSENCPAWRWRKWRHHARKFRDRMGSPWQERRRGTWFPCQTVRNSTVGRVRSRTLPGGRPVRLTHPSSRRGKQRVDGTLCAVFVLDLLMTICKAMINKPRWGNHQQGRMEGDHESCRD